MSRAGQERERPLAPGLDLDLGLVDGLAQLSFLIQAMLTRIAAAEGLSLIQVRLLGTLRDRHPAMNDLARLLGLDKSSVTGLVDRAERRGLLRRTVNPRDRRAYEVGLTAKGRALARRVEREFEREAARLTAGLAPPEQASLSAAITRILLDDARAREIELFPGGSR